MFMALHPKDPKSVLRTFKAAGTRDLTATNTRVGQLLAPLVPRRFSEIGGFRSGMHCWVLVKGFVEVAIIKKPYIN